MELIKHEPFTKEQLIEIAQENVEVWQLAMETESLTQKEYAAIRLRVAEIALAALEVPDYVPRSVFDVIYQECDGFVDCGADPQTIWTACRNVMLNGGAA